MSAVPMGMPGWPEPARSHRVHGEAADDVGGVLESVPIQLAHGRNVAGTVSGFCSQESESPERRTTRHASFAPAQPTKPLAPVPRISPSPVTPPADGILGPLQAPQALGNRINMLRRRNKLPMASFQARMALPFLIATFGALLCHVLVLARGVSGGGRSSGRGRDLRRSRCRRVLQFDALDAGDRRPLVARILGADDVPLRGAALSHPRAPSKDRRWRPASGLPAARRR